MRRPRPVKTKKAAAKRFKITATGKVMRCRAGKRHLMLGKSSKRRRRLRSKVEVSDTDAHRVLEALPFSHRG